MSDEGTLRFATVIDITNMQQGIEKIMAKVEELTDKVSGKSKDMSESFSDIGKTGVSSFDEILEAGGNIDGLMQKLTKAAAGFGLALGAKELVSKIIEVRGEFQKLEVAFNTMLGSEQQANDLMQQLVRTAATTPFDLQGVAEGAKQLLAYGEDVNNVNDDLIRLGNIAAGLSQPLGDIVYLYGTTMTQGRLFTQDLNQFTNRGIPMISELAKVMGVAENKVRDLVEQGKIGFPEVQQVIQNLTNEGGMFYNLMEEQSKTISGQILNIEDAFESMFNELGKQSEGVINGALSVVSALVENYEKVGKILLALVATYGVYKAACIAVTAIQGLQTAGVGALTAAETIHYGWLVIVEKAQKLLNATMLSNPYVLVATAVATLIASLYALSTAVKTVKDYEEDYQKELDDAIAKEKEHKQQIDDLCNTAENEALSTKTRMEALRELELEYPNIFAKYDSEIEALKHIKELKEDIALLDGKNSVTNRRNQLDSLNQQLQEYHDRIFNELDEKARGQFKDDTEATVKRLLKEDPQYQALLKRRDKLMHEAEVHKLDDSTLLYNTEALQKQLQHRKDVLARMNQEGIDTYRLSGYDTYLSKDELQYQINILESAIAARNMDVKSARDWAAEKKKAYEEADKAYKNFINSPENLSLPDYEKKAQDLKDARDAAKKEADKYADMTGENKANTAAQKAAEKAERERQKEEREREKRERLKIQMRHELVQLEQETQDAEIDAMDEGLAKKLAQLDLEYARKSEALSKLADKWRKENKDAQVKTQDNGLTVEQDLAITNATLKNADLYKHEVQETEDAYLKQLVEEFGSNAQKIELVTKEFNKRIAEMPEEFRKEATKKMNEAVSALQFEDFKKTIKWDEIFGNLSEQSTNAILKNIAKIKAYLHSDTGKGLGITEIKNLQEALNNMEAEIVNRNPFAAIHLSLQAISRDKKELKDSLAEYQKAQKELTYAQNEYTIALANEQALREMINEGKLTEDSEMYTSAVNILTRAKKGLGKATENVSKTEDKVTKSQNKLTKSFANFINGLSQGNQLAQSLGENCKNLAAVFSSDIAEGIEKAFDTLNELVSATTGVVKAWETLTKKTAETISDVVEASSEGVKATAAAGATSISTLEKASAILAIISAVIQVATAIASLFNSDKAHEERIKELQRDIDQLKWEMSNMDASRLKQELGSVLDNINKLGGAIKQQIIDQFHSAETELEKLYIILTANTTLHRKLVDEVAAAYAHVDYNLTHALGSDRYNSASAKLKNMAEQIVDINEQMEEEQKKKKPDKDKIQDYKNTLEEIRLEMAKVLQDMMEDIIGGSAESIASKLGDAFIEAAKAGEDAMKKWGETVDGIVADIMKKMLIQELLEKPLGAIFNRYSSKWFDDKGNFLGFDVVMESMGNFSDDLMGLGSEFKRVWENLPDDVKQLFGMDESREAAKRGIATASQESVDENNARLTAIQGHTYNLMNGMNELNSTATQMLENLMGIERNTETANHQLDDVNTSLRIVRNTVEEMQRNGIKLHS